MTEEYQLKLTNAVIFVAYYPLKRINMTRSHESYFYYFRVFTVVCFANTHVNCAQARRRHRVALHLTNHILLQTYTNAMHANHAVQGLKSTADFLMSSLEQVTVYNNP